MSGWAPPQSFYDANKHDEDEVPPPPTCTITRVENGYVVTIPRQSSSGSEIVVHEDKTDGSGHVGALMGALYEIIEGLGTERTKHNDHGVTIGCKCKGNH